MPVLTDAQLDALIDGAGFPASARTIARAIARAESGGNTTAISSTGDYGLWQINARSHPSYDKARLLSDPAYNARAAYAISKGGKDWSPWTTYKTGAYSNHLDGTGSVVDTVTGTAGGLLSTITSTAGTVVDHLPTPGNIIGEATSSWVDPLVSKASTAALALVLTSAGLALIGLGLARLSTSSTTINQAVQAAGTAATVAAL